MSGLWSVRRWLNECNEERERHTERETHRERDAERERRKREECLKHLHGENLHGKKLITAFRMRLLTSTKSVGLSVGNSLLISPHCMSIY
jgi:hypothetical protein